MENGTFMQYIKSIIISIAIIIVSLLLYLFISFEYTHEATAALEEFAKGDYQTAEQLLKNDESSLSKAQYHLYRGYLERGKQQFQESDQQFSRALETAKQGQLLEIYLNQAFNAYLEELPKAMVIPLQLALKEGGGENSWVAFFSGLKDYLEGNFREASLKFIHPEEENSFSSWWQPSFDSIFTAEWFHTYPYLLKLSQGQYLDVRQSLDKDKQDATPEQLKQIHFLLGLTYVKEAQAKPPGTGLPYYQLAFTNFDKMDILSSQYKWERISILNGIQIETQALITNGSFQDLPFYVGILQKWGDKKQLNDLAISLEALVNKQLNGNNRNGLDEMTQVLGTILPEGSLRKTLQTRFEKLLKTTIESGTLTNLEVYWKAAAALSPHPEVFTDTYANSIAAKILELIPSDDERLLKTKPYFDFWEKTEKNERKRNLFAEKLVAVAGALWTRDNQEKKGINLIKMASVLPGKEGQKGFHDSIEKTISQIYISEMKRDETENLPYVLQAIQEFQLTSINIHDKQQILSHIADAQSLFDNKKYTEARKKGKWVLELEPNNVKAQRIVGLSDYHLGDYSESLAILSKLPEQDNETREAVAASMIIAGDASAGQQLLAKIGNTRPLTPSLYLTLGMGSLMYHNPAAAITWLDKVPQKGNEVYAGLFLAAFEQKRWEDALAYFQKLTPPYSTLKGLQAVAILTLMALGKDDQAESMIQQLVKQGPDSDESELSDSFKALKRKRLDSIDHYYIAGLFYKYVKKDNRKALKNYEKMQTLSAESLLARAKALLEADKVADAITDLNKAIRMSGVGKAESTGQGEALRLLAEAYQSTGQDVEAMNTYKDYLAIHPSDIQARRAYARALMQLHLYGQAIGQWQLVDKVKPLDSQELLEFIECLTYTSQFDQANKIAEKWLAQTPAPPLTLQLRLARLLITTFNPSLFQKIIATIPDLSKRTAEENEELLRLWLATAQYSEAEGLTNKIRDELESSFTGLWLLADISSQLSKNDEAGKYALQAVKKEPRLLFSDEFIKHYGYIPEILRESDEAIRKGLTLFPKSLTWQIDNARNLIDTAIEKHVAEGSSIQRSQELKEAHDLLDKIGERVKEIPEWHLLKGEVFFLLDNNSDAEEEYRKAISLDPSYAEAYKQLSLVYGETKNTKGAISALKMSLKFDSSDADSWKRLALFEQLEGNSIDAIASLKNAVKYKPNDSALYINLGELLLKIKNPEDAKIALERSLKLSPNNIEALKLLYIALNDPNLRINGGNSKQLAQRQKEILGKIRSLDPKAAETLRLRFIKRK